MTVWRMRLRCRGCQEVAQSSRDPQGWWRERGAGWQQGPELGMVRDAAVLAAPSLACAVPRTLMCAVHSSFREVDVVVLQYLCWSRGQIFLPCCQSSCPELSQPSAPSASCQACVAPWSPCPPKLHLEIRSKGSKELSAAVPAGLLVLLALLLSNRDGLGATASSVAIGWSNETGECFCWRNEKAGMGQGQEGQKSQHELVSCMIEMVRDEAGAMLLG